MACRWHAASVMLASQRTRAVELDVEAFSRRLYFKARGDEREDFFGQVM
jgi:hypothetical protein